MDNVRHVLNVDTVPVLPIAQRGDVAVQRDDRCVSDVPSFLTYDGVEKDLLHGSACCSARDAFGEPLPCIRRIHIGAVLKLRQALWLDEVGNKRDRKQVLIHVSVVISLFLIYNI
jgi:hypothetical protein